MLIESLEGRLLFATSSVSNHVLTVTGLDSSTADQLQLTSANGADGTHVYVTDLVSGAVFDSGGGITKVVINLRNGNDYVRLRTAEGTFPVFVPTSIVGGNGADTIYAGDGADTITGGDANDRIAGYVGADQINGGSGFDTADYSYSALGVNVTLNDSAANDGRPGEADLVTNAENVLGGSGNDVLTGNGNANLIDGGAGNDLINGLGGNDTLTGGAGLDTLLGDSGNDFLFAKEGLVDGINDGAGTDSAQVDTGSVADVAVAAAVSTLGSPALVSALIVSGGIGTLDGETPATLDSSFSDDGISAYDTSIGNFTDVVDVLSQDVAGELKTLVIGSTYARGNQDFFILRLNEDGSVDSSFGNDPDYAGFAFADFSFLVPAYEDRDDAASKAVIDADGNIVVVGTTYQAAGAAVAETGERSDFAIARFTADGDTDESFGEVFDGFRGGMKVYDFHTEYFGSDGNDTFDMAEGVVAHTYDLGDGFTEQRYAVVGSVDDDVNKSIGLMEFTNNGDISSDFTASVYNVPGRLDMPVDMVEGNNQHLVVLASRTNPSDFNRTAALVRYTAEGEQFSDFELDTFSTYGNVSPQAIAYDSESATYVVAGGLDSQVGGVSVGFIANVFYGEGVESSVRSITDPGRDLNVSDIAVDNQGHALVVGTTAPSDTVDDDFITFRFDVSTLLDDTTFNNGSASVQTGITPTEPEFDSDRARAVAVQPDGKIVVAGLTDAGGTVDVPAVARYFGSFTDDPIAEVIVTDEEVRGTTFTYVDPEGGTGELPDYLHWRFNFVHVDEANTLVVNGTEGKDYITVTQLLDESGNPVIQVRVNDDVTWYNVDEVTNVQVNAFGDDDTIVVDDTLDVPLLVMAGAGDDTINMGPLPIDENGNWTQGELTQPLPPAGTGSVTLNGEDDDDTFNIAVARNGAELFGGEGDDDFNIYDTLATVSGTATGVGALAEPSAYNQNGTLYGTPGPGNDVFSVYGVNLDDGYVITDQYVQSGGNKVYYGDAEIVFLAGGQGDDTFDYQSKRVGTTYYTDRDLYEEVIDNNTAGKVTVTGTWTASSYDQPHFGSNYLHDGNSGKGSRSVKYTPSLPTDGNYEVFAYWPAAKNRATNTQFVVHTASGDVIVNKNQTTSGGVFVSLGVYNLDADTASLTIKNNGTSGFVVADAVKFVRQPILVQQPVDPVIVDDAAAHTTGTWTRSTSNPGFFGPNYRHDANGSKGFKTATFTPNLPVSGTWEVFARWASGSNRSSAVPYKINFDGGSTTVFKDQRTHGAEWISLGTFTFDAGTGGSVFVTNAGTTGFVTIDAIKWELVEAD